MADGSVVEYPATGVVRHGRLVEQQSAFGFEETIARLKAAIAAEDMWVVAELDPQMLLTKGGYTIRPTRQIFYFHPRYMSRLLVANPAAIIEAPPKIVVMTGPDGAISVRHPDIGAALAAYVGMSEIASELVVISHRILSSITA
jgi:uncharacterized protein (DUF302 family)